MGRGRWKPDRISSSVRTRPDGFKLDQPPGLVGPGRHGTLVNCNPNCNPDYQLVQGDTVAG